jgi:3-phenylpropionate/trans-cinnamate dioxygenase ferredoxin reductase subunit
MRTSVTIVGASLAGLRAAQALRREGFDGPVTLIGDELRAPYDRPPLSKQVLAGDWEPERTALLTDDELAALDLDLQLGRRATGLDVGARRLELDGADSLPFDGLVIATGASPRRLPGTEHLAGVHTLRTLDDCLRLRADFDAAPRRVVVVGAGFIGAEVAATARGRGLDVTILEALPVPLGRVLGETVGNACADLHRDHGVDLRLGVGVAGIDGTDRVERIRLEDGSSIDADVVVVGIGVAPNTDWLAGSGLTVDNGVVCDATTLAAPGITAAGDVARWPNELFGELMRVEHWDHAIEMGTAAARRLVRSDDEAEPFSPVPYFWSDQSDRKIQHVGRARPDDEVELVTGSFEERRFAVIFGRGGRIVAALGFNRPRHVMQYRRLIVDRTSWDDARAFAAAQADAAAQPPSSAPTRAQAS